MREPETEGFFCAKCGTVYAPGILACRVCNSREYRRMENESGYPEDVAMEEKHLAGRGVEPAP